MELPLFQHMHRCGMRRLRIFCDMHRHSFILPGGDNIAVQCRLIQQLQPLCSLEFLLPVLILHIGRKFILPGIFADKRDIKSVLSLFIQDKENVLISIPLLRRSFCHRIYGKNRIIRAVQLISKNFFRFRQICRGSGTPKLRTGRSFFKAYLPVCPRAAVLPRLFPDAGQPAF